ncbi:phage integrase central domain-containing protein [Neisseria sp.]|uniref:phage integrase central domain-containing protein n=1 Tax=Neisseria sp. TaxID=192066 RepID=UPI003916F403
MLNTFAAVTKQWHTKNFLRWKEKHAARIMQYFEVDVFPHIGNRPIKELRVSDIKKRNRTYRRAGRIGNGRKNQAMDRQRFQPCRFAGAYRRQPCRPACRLSA